MTLSVCGTPGFVAPEIYTGPAYSYSVDVWAAGVIVYKMVFGKLPFGLVKKMEIQDRVKQTCHGPLEFPEDPRKPISPALKDFLAKVQLPRYARTGTCTDMAITRCSRRTRPSGHQRVT